MGARDTKLGHFFLGSHLGHTHNYLVSTLVSVATETDTKMTAVDCGHGGLRLGPGTFGCRVFAPPSTGGLLTTLRFRARRR